MRQVGIAYGLAFLSPLAIVLFSVEFVGVALELSKEADAQLESVLFECWKRSCCKCFLVVQGRLYNPQCPGLDGHKEVALLIR